MIERAGEFGASAAMPLVVGDHTDLTAGDMLRQAREAHGLHLEVLAAMLKVSAHKLEALEADAIDALPDAVFARALAASTCRILKMDPAPVLAKLPGAPHPVLATADRTLGESFHSGAPHSGRASDWRPSRLLGVVVALLLVAAAAMVWLPKSAFDGLSATVEGWTTAGETGSQPSDESPVAAGAVADAPEVHNAPVISEESAAAAAPAPVAAAPTPEVTSAAAVTAPHAGDMIVFTARADSWIAVKETSGKDLLRRTLAAGQTVGVSGSLPLSVVIGRASGVDVQVRGKSFDLAPVTHGGGVARFEVKP